MFFFRGSKTELFVKTVDKVDTENLAHPNNPAQSGHPARFWRVKFQVLRASTDLEPLRGKLVGLFLVKNPLRLKIQPIKPGGMDGNGEIFSIHGR